VEWWLPPAKELPVQTFFNATKGGCDRNFDIILDHLSVIFSSGPLHTQATEMLCYFCPPVSGT